MKLKYGEIAPFREEMYKKQKGVCPLCKLHIPKGEAVLDHDHTSGRIRSVLHASCNSLEGIIANYLKSRSAPLRKSGGLEKFLLNLFKYLKKDYGKNPYHPKHKTEEDKLVKEYRRRLKAAKTDVTKQKYKNLLENLR